MYFHRVYCKKEKDIGRLLTYKKRNTWTRVQTCLKRLPFDIMCQNVLHISSEKCYNQVNITLTQKTYYRYAALSLSIIYELYAFECIDLVPGNNKTMTLNKCFILSHFKMLTGNLNPFFEENILSWVNINKDIL